MARRYSRDNRGRFAGGGGGATARGGRLKTAAGNKRKTQTVQADGAKAAGTIKGKVKRDPSAAGKIGKAKPASAPKAASVRRKAVGADKVARLSARVNAVTANAASKSGVKRMNATEVGVRAKSFLARKAGGMSGMVGKNFTEQQAVVRSGLASRPRYSTQKPNRNKPSRYNALGQDKARVTARLASQTAREKIAAAASKPANTRTPSRNRLLGRRELAGTRLGAGNAPATTKAARVGSAIKRPVPAKAPSMVVRTRKQSKSTQRFRREGILARTRQPGAIGMGGLRKNPRIHRQQTGMSQLSLMGKAKPLVRFRSVRG